LLLVALQTAYQKLYLHVWLGLLPRTLEEKEI
jgi:hypothetical protein